MSSYTKLAHFMAERQHPILRKYLHLAARDLLYLQAEICKLESEYEAAAKEDLQANDERKLYSRDWSFLESSRSRGFGGRQWQSAIQIRDKLREYHDALLRYSQIASIRRPRATEVDILETWIKTQARESGRGFLGDDLLGTDVQPAVYDALHHEDLAMLVNNHGEDDFFTRFINGPLLRVFHRLRESMRSTPPAQLHKSTTENLTPGMYHYDEAKLGAVAHVAGTVLSSLAPLSSIIALSFVKGDRARLGLICAFTLLFTLCLAIATSARRVEIFAATAAFASVQVVFVGSTGGATPGAGS